VEYNVIVQSTTFNFPVQAMQTLRIIPHSLSGEHIRAVPDVPFAACAFRAERKHIAFYACIVSDKKSHFQVCFQTDYKSEFWFTRIANPLQLSGEMPCFAS